MNAAEWAVMTTNEERGQTIKRRRLALGIGSVSEFTRATKRLGGRDVKGVSMESIAKAEEGVAGPRTYDRLESWLDQFEEEVGFKPGENQAAAELAASASNGPEFVEFHIGAIDVTVKGPVANLAEIEAAVEKLIRGTKPRD